MSIAAAGGRLDHAAANLAVLASPRWAGATVEATIGRNLGYGSCATGSRSTVRPATLVSLLPMGGPAEGVRTDGAALPSSMVRTLEPLAARGVSNVMTEFGRRGLDRFGGAAGDQTARAVNRPSWRSSVNSRPKHRRQPHRCYHLVDGAGRDGPALTRAGGRGVKLAGISSTWWVTSTIGGVSSREARSSRVADQLLAPGQIERRSRLVQEYHRRIDRQGRGPASTLCLSPEEHAPNRRPAR